MITFFDHGDYLRDCELSISLLHLIKSSIFLCLLVQLNSSFILEVRAQLLFVFHMSNLFSIVLRFFGLRMEEAKSGTKDVAVFKKSFILKNFWQ